VLSDISTSFGEGSFTSLLGPSGSGKTTLLRIVAGFIKPDTGNVSIGGSDVTDMPVWARNIGMVFQNYALFPHMTVAENVGFGLARRGIRGEDAERQVDQALEMVRLPGYGTRRPKQLSGGQQQRVALARALVGRPKLLLFDEPLSNLDASLRRSLREELAELHREIGFTGLYVTHDQAEALALGTDIAVMDSGRIIQSGSPTEIYERPATEFVARFFGANIVQGSSNGPTISTPFGEFLTDSEVDHGNVVVAFMPDAVEIEANAQGSLVVKWVTYLGAYREIGLANDRCEFIAIERTRKPAPEVNAKVSVRITPADLHAYPAAR
jgi:putative spermidine/putrescine transport system ATP-binding protein/spermidine/putrescine transport system ATP-binding protein